MEYQASHTNPSKKMGLSFVHSLTTQKSRAQAANEPMKGCALVIHGVGFRPLAVLGPQREAEPVHGKGEHGVDGLHAAGAAHKGGAWGPRV